MPVSGLGALASLANHPSLRQLTIDCSYSGIANVPLLANILVGLSRSLQVLYLNFAWCTSLQMKEMEFLSDHGLSSLRGCLVDSRLDFVGCKFPLFLPKIEELQSLETLDINYSHAQTKANGKTLPGYLQIQRLQELRLGFQACPNVMHIKPLKKLGQLPHLHTLAMNFDYCHLSEVEEHGCLANLGKLSFCQVSFIKCT